MSVHWYSGETGEPRYTVIGSNGKERDTNLRDARKLNLWPSVTTIIACAAAPGFDYYKQQQLLEAAWAENRKPDMYKDEWSRRVVTQSKQHAKNASDRGNQIHNTLEQIYKNTITALDTEDFFFIDPVVKFLEREFPNAQWIAEASFCSPLGFGGKVDLHDPVNKIVLDFETKDTDDIKKMVAYDGHHMQTAAYAVGLYKGDVRDLKSSEEVADWKRYNLFISTQTPGLLNLTESKDFGREWGMFEALLKYWQLSNKYEPDFNET